MVGNRLDVPVMLVFIGWRDSLNGTLNKASQVVAEGDLKILARKIVHDVSPPPPQSESSPEAFWFSSRAERTS
jgi:hypothetical protein